MSTKAKLSDITKNINQQCGSLLEETARIKRNAESLFQLLCKQEAQFQREEKEALRQKKDAEQQELFRQHAKAWTMPDDVEEPKEETAPVQPKQEPVKAEEAPAEKKKAEKKAAPEKTEEKPAEKPAEMTEEKAEEKPAEKPVEEPKKPEPTKQTEQPKQAEQPKSAMDVFASMMSQVSGREVRVVHQPAPRSACYGQNGQGPKVGRNDPCPCGSGKKFKNCCGRGQI